MKRWVIGVVVMAVLGSLAVVSSVRNSALSVQVATVEKGEIREFIDERGKTRVPRVYRITTPQAGRIKEITLDEGSVVKQGQEVARIVSEDLENAVDEVRSVVERLDAAIVENDDIAMEKILAVQATEFVQSMDKTVEAAKAQVEASGKRAEYAETKLGRSRRLHESRATAEDALDKADLEYWEGQLGFRENTLTMESMKSIRAATALLPQMVAEYISHKGLTRSVLEKQRSEAQARLRQIMTQRDRGTMLSPSDGVVLERLIEDEQYVAAGTQLLTIGQLDALEIETDVLSQDVVRVDLGDEAEVYGPAVGGPLGQGVPGVVSKIYPAGFTKISSLGVEQQRVKVIVQLAAEDVQRLRQMDVGVDYRVRTRIYTELKAGSLLVPRSSLFRGPGGGWQLFVAAAKRAELRGVTVGLMNDVQAEIIDGLAEGDQVILAPETSLSHGARIAPVEP